MTLVQLPAGEARPIPFALVVALLVGFHVVRALLVTNGTAQRWLADRGFAPEPRDVVVVRSYLLRLRWSRVVATLLAAGVMVLLLTVWHVGFGLVWAPYLLSLLVTECLAPSPRHGRERVASLVVRPADYYAPRRLLRLARVLLVAALLTSLAATTGSTQPRFATSHAVAVLLSLVAFEASLRVTSRRGLSAAPGDQPLDSAIRVASSRSCTAGGLAAGYLGLVLGSALLVQTSAGTSPLRDVYGGLVQLGGIAVLVAVVVLSQPLRRWAPR